MFCFCFNSNKARIIIFTIFFSIEISRCATKCLVFFFLLENNLRLKSMKKSQMVKWFSLDFVELRWQYLSFTLFLQRYICFDAKLTHHCMSLCDEIRAVWVQMFLYRDSFYLSVSILCLFWCSDLVSRWDLSNCL